MSDARAAALRDGDMVVEEYGAGFGILRCPRFQFDKISKHSADAWVMSCRA
jgi:hypothetical protein